MRVVTVYRPPPSSTNRYTVNMFLEEFPALLELLVLCPGKLILTGDFNFHVDDPSDSSALKFLDLLSSFNLHQHIDVPTHKDGHTLDLIITRSNEQPVSDFFVFDPLISDHFAKLCNLSLDKPSTQKQVITYRKLRSIDADAFRLDVTNSLLCQSPKSSLPELCDQYDVLTSILYAYAPLQSMASYAFCSRPPVVSQSTRTG